MLRSFFEEAIGVDGGVDGSDGAGAGVLGEIINDQIVAEPAPKAIMVKKDFRIETVISLLLFLTKAA